MRVRRMIVNRMTDWYNVVDANSDPFYLAMLVLDKLSTRLKRGIIYDRMDMAFSLVEQRNNEIIEILDKAIAILISRSLVALDPTKDMKKRLMITDLGQAALNSYREELNNENK